MRWGSHVTGRACGLQGGGGGGLQVRKQPPGGRSRPQGRGECRGRAGLRGRQCDPQDSVAGMRDFRRCRSPPGSLPVRGVVHASGLCPRTGPQACSRKADVPRPEESSGLAGHSDREEEGLTRQPRSCLDRGTTGVPGAARAEAQTVAPGARSTVVRGHLGPVKSRAPVSEHQGRCSQGAGKGPGKAKEGSSVLRAT